MSRIPLIIEQRKRQLAGAADELEVLAKRFEEHNFESTLGPILSSLRALLVKTPSNHPLLLDLADELDIRLDVYGPPANMDAFHRQVLEITKASSLLILPDSLNLTKAVASPRPMNLREWLDEPTAFVYGNRLTGKDMVRGIGSKEGAHYDNSWPDWLLELKRYELAGKCNGIWEIHRQTFVACGPFSAKNSSIESSVLQ